MSRNPNLLLAQYLVHAAAYHVYGENLVSDFRFDKDARELAARWEEVTLDDKRLIEIAALKVSSSGFYIKFTNRILHCAQWRIRLMKGLESPALLITRDQIPVDFFLG